jgi:hypothetical protein
MGDTMSDRPTAPESGPPRPDLASPNGGLPPPPSTSTPHAADASEGSKTDGFAIAALVLGILGVLGLPFGIIALRRINRRGSSGRGLAIAGIVLGSFWVVLIGLGALVGILGSAERSPEGDIVETGRVTFEDLRVGDCVAELPEGNSITVAIEPCPDPHAGEVYEVTTLPAGPWPGKNEVVRLSEGACAEALPAYVSADAESIGYEIFYFHPLEQSWSADRNVICVATDPSG